MMFVTNISQEQLNLLPEKSAKKSDNLEVKMPAGTLGARGTEFLIFKFR